MDVETTYVTGLLLPMIVLASGLGLTFMPLTLAAVSKVADRGAGLASGVLNTTQQIGGSLGLAVLSTVAVTVTTNRLAELSQGAQGPPPPNCSAWRSSTATRRPSRSPRGWQPPRSS